VKPARILSPRSVFPIYTAAIMRFSILAAVAAFSSTALSQGLDAGLPKCAVRDQCDAWQSVY
jgi:hypothetical protein